MVDDTPAGFRRAARLLGWLAWIVPARLRPEWRAEWQAEMWHRLDEQPHRSVINARQLAGALPHALALRVSEWRLPMLHQDIHYAWRGLRRRPVFTILIVAMLAAGIGVNTAMFTVVDSVLIRPLPYPHAEDLMLVHGVSPALPSLGMSPPDLLDYRAASTGFASLAGFFPASDGLLTGAQGAEEVPALAVTTNYFTTFGINPFIGRGFRDDDAGRRDVVIISYALWRRRFDSDPAIVGTAITLDAEPVQVIGVMPPVIDNTMTTQLFRPYDFHSNYASVRAYHTLNAVGRLKHGVTPANATAAMNVVAEGLTHRYPEDSTWRIALMPYRTAIVGGIDRVLLLLAGAVGLVLLIACGNVASLLLGRAVGRRREIGVRRAIGATRIDVIRLLLAESVILGTAGGALGLAAAIALIRLVRTMQPRMLPRVHEIAIDWRVLLFVAGISMGSSILFGLVPALHATEDGSARAGRARVRLRDLIVGGQVALSLILLVGGGLLLRSLWQAEAVDPGFRATGVLTAGLSLPARRYDDAARDAFWSRLLEKVDALPGVTSAATTTKLAFASWPGGVPFWITGHPPGSQSAKNAQLADIYTVSSKYFDAMRIPVVAGVLPRNRDEGLAGVAINASLARRLFPGHSAIGARISWDVGAEQNAPIVAVVGDVRTQSLLRAPADMMYFVEQPTGMQPRTIIIRSSGDPSLLTRPLTDLVRGLDPDLPLTHLQTMTDVVARTTVLQRWLAGLLGSFATFAALLALAGVYGALAFVVVSRTREFGIRQALGAQRRQIAQLVLRRGMLVMGAGIAIGLAGAFATTRLIQSWLFEVAPTDPLAFAGATGLLCFAGAAACVIPARRAMRVEPQAALGAEG